jgi:hypothetical protein
MVEKDFSTRKIITISISKDKFTVELKSSVGFLNLNFVLGQKKISVKVTIKNIGVTVF